MKLVRAINMTCYYPLNGYRSARPNPSGKYPVIVTKKHNGQGNLQLKCGRCHGCRLDHSGQWAIRCMHEATLHKANSFITLTYDQDNYPVDGSLNLKHFQDFMKRLRYYTDKKIRFFHCGEYGESLGRPHYHAAIFGYDFPDKYIWKTEKGNNLYNSDLLDKAWKKGYAVIGSLTYESAAYVARYVMKKINGKKKEERNEVTDLRHYDKINTETGEIIELKQEYTTMSRGEGIGKGYYEKYKSDIFPSDTIVMRTKSGEAPKKLPVPRYYSTQYELTNPEEFEKIRAKRMEQQKKRAKDNTKERLKDRETCRKAKTKTLKRDIH